MGGPIAGRGVAPIFAILAASLAGFLATAAPVTVGADGTRLQSGPERVTLLELYTSEGCSSCPPADRWLIELQSDDRLWDDIVPVAFHVDYWDYIGWPDRFAAPEYGQRQKTYAQQGNLRNVYTPGLVLGGREWRSWFRRPHLELPPAADVGILSVDADLPAISITYEPRRETHEPLEVHYAVLGFDISTQVQGGENNGRRLKHGFVVLAYGNAPIARRAPGYSGRYHLPPLRADAPRMALAAWVSTTSNQRPLQAVGGWLPRVGRNR